MTADPPCPHTIDVAALVIGALPASERNELLVHLRHCDRCQDELVLLAPLPGMLRRARPDVTAS